MTKLNEKNQLKVRNMIHEMFRAHGAEWVRGARVMYRKYGRGYLNICIKDYHPFKAGDVCYITEEGNRAIEAKMDTFTENDAKLANYLSNYEPSNQVVVMVWYGRFYYVNVLTDTSTPLLSKLKAAVMH
jgi:hypothetical protein